MPLDGYPLLLCVLQLVGTLGHGPDAGSLKPFESQQVLANDVCEGETSALCALQLRSSKNEVRRDALEGFGASAQTPQASFWPQKGGGPTRAGASPFPLPSFAHARPPTTVFPDPQGGVVRATPLIDKDRNIYVVTVTTGIVRKLSPNGTELWNYKEPTGGQIPEVPALTAKSLIYVTLNGWLVALDLQTGFPVHRVVVAYNCTKCVGEDTWSLLVAGDILISGRSKTEGGTTFWIDAYSISKKAGLWQTQVDPMGIELAYNFMPSAADGGLFFQDWRGTPRKLNILTGEKMWIADPYADRGYTTGGLVIGPDKVLYSTSNNLRANVTVNERNLASMSITLGYRQNGYVTAYNMQTGVALWRTPTHLPANSGPAVGKIMINGTLRLAVVAAVGGNPYPPLTEFENLALNSAVVALDPARNGTVLWNYSLPPWHGAAAGDNMTHICMPDSFSNPVIDGSGTVLVGSMSGVLYGLADRNGDGILDEAAGEVASYQSGAGFQSSGAIGPDLFAIAPCNGLLIFDSAATTTSTTTTPTRTTTTPPPSSTDAGQSSTATTPPPSSTAAGQSSTPTAATYSSTAADQSSTPTATTSSSTAADQPSTRTAATPSSTAADQHATRTAATSSNTAADQSSTTTAAATR